MSGQYLYCQNESCGVYLGCSGGNDCQICGWSAGRDIDNDELVCALEKLCDCIMETRGPDAHAALENARNLISVYKGSKS